jgi:hypothetical protein
LYWKGNNILNTILKKRKMVRISIVLILIFVCGIKVSGQQDSLLVRRFWSGNTAYLVPAGKWETGIFQPFRYGINDKLEIHSSALLLPLIPNAGIRVVLGTHNGYTFTSDHALSYPTIFLKVISRKGIGGLISPDFDFTSIFSISNSLLVSKPLGSSTVLSGFAGFSFALRSRKPEWQSTIDLPLVYPRMAQFYEGTVIKTGISVKKALCKKWMFEEGINAFFITRSRNNFFAENNGNIMWVAGRSFRIRLGYNLSYGNYPFGKYWQLWPSFDLVFGSRLR